MLSNLSTTISIALILIIGLSSCGEKEGSVNLNFTAVYDDAPLVLLQDYTYTNGDVINFGTSNFFISNVFLSNDDGDQVQIMDLDMIDFGAQNLTAELAEEPISISINDVDPGDYSSITFSVGLDPETNQTRPSDYTPDSPLSLSGNYWVAWDSYIFAKFQGNLSNPDLGDNIGWLFHTGKDEVYRTFTFPIEKSIDENVVNIDVELDHREIFALDNGYMDIRSKPTNHDPNDLEPFIIITENFEAAVSIQ